MLLVLLLIARVGSVLSILTSSFAMSLIGRDAGTSAPVLPLAIDIVRESMAAELCSYPDAVFATAA